MKVPEILAAIESASIEELRQIEAAIAVKLRAFGGFDLEFDLPKQKGTFKPSHKQLHYIASLADKTDSSIPFKASELMKLIDRNTASLWIEAMTKGKRIAVKPLTNYDL